MRVLSEEFESEIRVVIREQFKESFTDFLQHETVEQRWLSLESAAYYANVSSRTISKWIRMGLNLYKIDGTKRIDKNELDQFIQNHVVI